MALQYLQRGRGGIVRARTARGSPPYTNQAKQEWKLDLTSIAALLPPEQVVFSQNAPVATRLCSSEQVPRLQEGEYIESQLEGKGELRLGGCSKPRWCPQAVCHPEPTRKLLPSFGQDHCPARCPANNHNCSRAVTCSTSTFLLWRTFQVALQSWIDSSTPSEGLLHAPGPGQEQSPASHLDLPHCNCLGPLASNTFSFCHLQAPPHKPSLLPSQKAEVLGSQALSDFLVSVV